MAGDGRAAHLPNSFGELCPSRQRLPEPCKRHSPRTILAFLLLSSPLGQEHVGFSSLMQIPPLEKLHSCRITFVALVVVATERLPRARVELSFAQTRDISEVFRRKKSRGFHALPRLPSWETVRLLTPYQQTPPWSFLGQHCLEVSTAFVLNMPIWGWQVVLMATQVSAIPSFTYAVIW